MREKTQLRVSKKKRTSRKEKHSDYISEIDNSTIETINSLYMFQF